MTAAVPRHLAIVMDGNRRWARRRHLPAIAGHRAGVDTIRRTLRAARERGVEYLTLYSFSTENWTRDEEEVGALMSLLEETIRRETKTLVEDGVRLMVIGRLHELSDRLQKAIAGAIMATAGGKRGVMTLAFNYGGRAEIIDAVKKLVRDRVAEDAVDEHAIATRLYAPEHPDPHGRRAARLQFPALGGRLRGDVGDRGPVARFLGKRSRPGAQLVRAPRAALRPIV